MEFNLNQTIRVRLTDDGRAALKAQHDQLNTLSKGLLGDYQAPVEDEGWSQWTAWELFSQLGQMLQHGFTPPFESIIEVLPFAESGYGYKTLVVNDQESEVFYGLLYGLPWELLEQFGMDGRLRSRMAVNFPTLHDDELKVLHRLLLDIPASAIKAANINSEVYSQLGSKSVVLQRDGVWPDLVGPA